MARNLAEELLWLCRIPSMIGEEQALCDALVERFQTEFTTAAPLRRYKNSLVVPLTRGRGPHVALAGHLDTVRTEHDGPPRIEGTRLYGAGASDMKSGLAVMLELAKTPDALPVDVTLVFYSGEEGPYENNELGIVLDEDPELSSVDIACCLEPSDNHVHLGCAGSLHARFSFRGKTAHSARPWQGENAIHKAARCLQRLGELTPTEQHIDGLTWQSVVSATMASGGRAPNIIPDRFDVNVNSRFGPETTLDQAKASLLTLAGGDAVVDFVDESPPAMPFRHHPHVASLLECKIRGLAPKQAWTDVGRLSARGIVAVNLGPGVNSQAHQPNEWTDLPLLDEGLALFRDWLGRIGLSASSD